MPHQQDHTALSEADLPSHHLPAQHPRDERAERDRLQAAIDSLAPWFHNFHLPGDVQTAPHHFLGDFPHFKWKQIEPHIPQDLRGWHVLDIGCNAGYYSIALAQRGAEVLGIDIDPHYLKQAQWIRAQFGCEQRIRFRQMPVYDIARFAEADSFDLVWFMGVFYHLRYPQLALDLAARCTRRMLVFQSLTMPGDCVTEPPDDIDILDRDIMLDAGWPKMAFIEKKLARDPTNWWAPNRACVEAMLRSSGLRIVARPEHEIYICEPDPDRDPILDNLLTNEMHSATGVCGGNPDAQLANQSCNCERK